MNVRYLLIPLALLVALAAASPAPAASAKDARVEYKILPNPGTKVYLDSSHYFTFAFDKSPKIGVVIMKVDVFTTDGRRDTSFVVKGDADMPSMRGAHTMGDKAFSLSAKGVYLLPIRLVMPGDWEVRFTFEKNGKTVYRGAYLFDI